VAFDKLELEVSAKSNEELCGTRKVLLGHEEFMEIMAHISLEAFSHFKLT